MINKLFRIISFCYQLIKLNIFWVIFTGLGLVFIGVIPATVSLVRGIKKMLAYEEVTFKDFYYMYKKNLIVSNKKLGIFIIVTLMLYTEILFFSGYKLVIFLYIIFIFQLLVFFNIIIEDNWENKSIGNIVMNSVKDVLSKPKNNLIFITGFLLLFRISLSFKGFSLFLSVSLLMLIGIYSKRLDKRKK